MNNQDRLMLDSTMSFYCEFCSGTSYEDYPFAKKPCRVSTHEQRHHAEVRRIFGEIKHEWSSLDGMCPYCKMDGSCVHWDGTGWTRDKRK